MNKQILLINCAYRVDSVTDQMMHEVARHIKQSGYTYEMLNLREQEFAQCINCRVCSQEEKNEPGKCITKDRMNDIVTLIEECDAYVLASPAKFNAPAKFFKCFLSRLVVYSYWPFGAKKPKPIKILSTKKAILISVFPIPTLIAKLYSKTINQLKRCAKLFGAQIIDVVYIGMTPISLHRNLSYEEKKKAKSISEKLTKSL